MIVGRLPFYQAWKNGASISLKRRRFQKIMELAALPETGRLRILEVGCATGKDVIQFLRQEPRFEIWGIDIQKQSLEGVQFVQADASCLPFPDKSFDLVVSVGLLEHIEPMEKLSRAIEEINRVGKHMAVVIPSVSTILEPHNGELFFSLRFHQDMMSLEQKSPLRLNYFTEHTWTKFPGFSSCHIRRFWYLPFLIKNTILYK